MTKLRGETSLRNVLMCIIILHSFFITNFTKRGNYSEILVASLDDVVLLKDSLHSKQRISL